MKLMYAVVPAAAVALLAGCSGFWTAPPSASTTTTTTSTTLSSGAFYVLNQNPAEIAGYGIASGSLQQISGSPYLLQTGATPSCIAVAPSGNFLYVGTISGIFVYAIEANGILNAIPVSNGGNISPTEQPMAMRMDPSGSWLVDAYTTGTNGTAGLEVNAIPIGANGVLDNSRSEEFLTNLPSSASVGITSNSMAISPAVQGVSQQYVFVATGEAGTIAIPFAAGNAIPLGTSNLPRFLVLHPPGAATSVAVDPQDRLFYIGETNANSTSNPGGLRVFDYSTLTENTSYSPLSSGGTAPNAILPEASGSYVYVANGAGTSSGNIAWFSISSTGTSYTVAAGSNVATGVNPAGLAEDSNGNFVLAESTGGDPYLSAYIFDTTTVGQLDLALTANNYPAITVTAIPAIQ